MGGAAAAAASLTCCVMTMLSDVLDGVEGGVTGVEGGVTGLVGPRTPTFRFLCMGLSKTGDWSESGEEAARSKFCLLECGVIEEDEEEDCFLESEEDEDCFLEVSWLGADILLDDVGD